MMKFGSSSRLDIGKHSLFHAVYSTPFQPSAQVQSIMCTTNCGRELFLAVYVVGQVELAVTSSHPAACFVALPSEGTLQRDW